MKQFTKYICVFLMMAGMSVSAWGTTETIDFTENCGKVPQNTSWYGSGSYNFAGYAINATDVKYNSYNSTLLLNYYYSDESNHNAWGCVTLPQINGVISSIQVTTPSSAGETSRTIDLYVNGVRQSTSSGITGGNSYTFTSLSIAANSTVELRNSTSNNEFHLATVVVTHNGSQLSTGTVAHGFISVNVIGTGSVAVGKNPIDNDESSTLVATPASGWVFDHWEITAIADPCNDSYSYETYNAFGYDVTPNSTTNPSITLTNNFWFDVYQVTATFVEADCDMPTVTFDTPGPTYKKYTSNYYTNAATAKYDGSSTGQSISYVSDNTSVATVNSSGTITLKGTVGTATITATAAANSTYCEASNTHILHVYSAPTVTNTNFAVSSVAPTSATFVGGQVSNYNNKEVTQYGWILNTSSTVDYDNRVAVVFTNGNSGLNTNFPSKSTTADALTEGTTYYVRPFATNGIMGYAPAIGILSFTTPYAITLDKNGGTTNGSAYVLPDGTTLTNISEPTREHYTVEGYYTTSGMTTKIATDEGALQASVEVSSTTWTNGSSQWKRGAGETFYAKWTPVDYTISFNSNGGSGSMSSVEKAYNSSYSLPSCTFTPPSGKVFDHWGAGSAGGTSYDVDDSYTVTGDITFYAVWKDGTPTDLVFSCAELEITGPTGNLVFITSAASKIVRSQEAFHIEGSGLSASQSITFTHSNSTIASKFAYKTSDGTALSTDASGEIDTDFYIYYTPDEGDTDDGLDVFTNLQAKVTEGLKPKASNILSTKTVMGRHLPADFVIAGKKDGKWWAMPSNMASTTNPKPSEIAVDDIDDPSIAYTATSNIYSLEGPTASNISGEKGDYIRFVMTPLWVDDADHSKGHAPLFGNSTGSNDIGKSGNSQATSDLPSGGWWWKLVQTNMSITNPQDAKYTIYNYNNTSSLSLRDNAGNPDWGLFASGVEELRLIPASDIVFTEAYFVEWGQHGGVIEVDATGIDATSVVAHLGEATSSAITLSQTGTSGGKSSKYNYTVNFGDGIDFAASTSNGAMLTLEWKNGETVKAISNIVVPKIIASSATMKSIMSGDAQWETEVHVLPDVTLTANAGDFESNDVMIKQLEIYPGATVVVTKGAAGSGTLKVKTLVLRNGWTCASGTRKYDVARLYITPSTASLAKNAVGDVWYMDWYIDYDQYYPIAVPWKVAVNSSNIVHRYTSNTATFGPSGSIRLRYYDGEQRATSGQSMIGQNWKDYGKSGNENLPAYLEPSKGYSFSAKRPSGKAFSIVRMTLGIPSNDWTALGEQGEVSGTHKDQVSVTGWGKGTADWYAMGWNFIGNPYMCTFNGDDAGISGKLELQNGGSIKYATIPSIDFSNYDQVAIADADLKPARGFFIQANNAEAQNITFNASKIVDPTAAPARYMTQTEAIPEQEAYIRLSYEGGKDQMGLIIGEDYTEAYEVNADLAKVLGDAGFVKTYMQYGGMDMAYVAINQELAKAWIPVTVILPKDGEYTFSLMSSSEVEQLEGVYLIDYAENETVTNLIDKDYTFVADAATISNRFAINAIIGERQTPTDIDVINEGGDLNSDRPFKFLYRDKVYIYHCGVIYDATGKKVK